MTTRTRSSGPVPAAPLAEAITDAVRQVIGPASGPIALHQPEFAGSEWEYVRDCIDTGWVSSVGSYVDRFERELAVVAEVRHAVATSNGTSALHVCLLLAGVERGDEVLVPALTFVATANAVSYAGGTSHFVDAEKASLGVDARKLDEYLRSEARVQGDVCINRRTGAPIRALVAMHTFGHPSDLDALSEVAQRWRLTLVEDAAESLGSYYHGRHTGNAGLVAALSFNGNKIVTTGGGGAVITNDSSLARKAKHITTTARTPHRWSFIHDQVGFNYRLPNLNAALGCAQLERLPNMLERKRDLATRYANAFAQVSGVSFLSEPAGTRSNYWLNTIVLARPDVQMRDDVLDALNSAGYMARPTWTLMHKLPMYSSCPRMPLETAEDLESSVVNIPSSACLAR